MIWKQVNGSRGSKTNSNAAWLTLICLDAKD